MNSTEEAVNKMLGNLSRIPSNVNSKMTIKEQYIEEIVKKSLNEQLMKLKSRGIV